MVDEKHYTSLDIAACILNAKGDPIDHLGLQKLVFITYGYAYAQDIKLFDEDILAWQYGPVMRNLYNQYRKYGYRNITGDAIPDEPPGLDDKTKEICSWVRKEYGHYSSLGLVKVTHAAGSPWSQAYLKGPNQVIADAAIKKYYIRMSEERKLAK